VISQFFGSVSGRSTFSARNLSVRARNVYCPKCRVYQRNCAPPARATSHPDGSSVPDLSSLGVVIRLKADLLYRVSMTAPSTWPEHVIRFVAALDRSNLRDTTAVLVLLTELRQELQLLLGIAEHTGPSVSMPPLDLQPDLRRSEMLTRFRQHILQVLLPVARTRRHVVPIADEARRIIEERYAEPLTLDVLAMAVGRSKRHLGAVFQQEFGLSVHQYLTRVRLNRAVALIRAGEKIEAVSLLVGYRSKKNFYRNFHAHIGVTPVAYRGALKSLLPNP
jgi:AraC-like DNA-binding protein